MNFNDAVSELLAIVKRPDLQSACRREINAAIFFYCTDNDFSRDYAEQVISLDAQEYTQSFALSLMTRFRKFKYLRRATKTFLTLVATTDLTKDACYLNDRYYIAGANCNISMLAKSATLDVGYYSYPPILTGGTGLNTFWLLDMQPFMIIERAAAVIFKSIGDEKSFSTYRESARETYLAFRKDQLSAQ